MLLKFKFLSLIKPLPLFLNKKTSILSLKYMIFLLIWLKYFKYIFKNPNLRINFFFYKKKNYQFSFSKAPIVHKTNSHERYKLTFYWVCLLIRVVRSVNTGTKNHLLIIIFLLKYFYCFYSTNLLQLQTFLFLYKFKINGFFKYHNLYDEIGRHVRLKT